MGDKVNHPDHYQNVAGVEAIDILNDVVKDLPGKQAALLWNSMKYLFRFQKKNGVEDLKKARNYLDYLIKDMETPDKPANKDDSEILWDTWFSKEYGHMTIYSKSKEPDGMPSKLVFDTKDAAEEFQSGFYNMLCKGYNEFSITDVALEMKFKTAKGNGWNNWDEPINWKKLHDEFTIKPYVDKYELIFVYKDSAQKKEETAKPDKTVNDPCVIYGSKTFGNAKVYYSTHMFAGMCRSIVFPSDLQRYMFMASFFAKLTARDFKAYSIRDVLADANFVVPDGTDNFSAKIPWKDVFSKFEMRTEGEKYILDFIYWIKTGTKKEEKPKPVNTTYGPCVIYDSKISGKAEVHYSMQMFAGTCTTIVFTSELARDMFINSFLNKLGKKRFSIRDVLNDTNFIVPSTADTFIVKMPWRDLFAKFKMRCEKGKFLLDFIYKQETFESLIKQPTNDEHILYKSTVWGSADVYYSTDMPQGTCTKILFDDEGGRNTFAIKFFRYLSTGAHSFSIQDILEDSKFMFPKEDNSLHFTMPWNEIFKGFHMTDEAGKYALEFIIDLQGGK